MDENERCGHLRPCELLPNGLLRGEAVSIMQPLEIDRWQLAEQSTSELIKCIGPSKPSEEHRNAVASYVQRLIMSCFTCQVFTCGSVPLKTYLPDGDIDLAAFCNNENLNDIWAHLIRDALEKEENNDAAEFRVRDVQYIQAEVKIIKCFVDDIMVDISFNQLGGLCTLCFLEEVDNLISKDHLFKRSIILIKAWCYYESRVLGAYHGLISTYALEILVLYIFHLFNNSFTGPLEVLYRFLDFFGKFDWENFCISLWGPVPVTSLPDITAHPPRNDGGVLLLSKAFLDACGALYTVHPDDEEMQRRLFSPKFLNVIDPLRVNNNLGRSVSKGNFFRIRSAFAYGAKKLRRVLDCPIEDVPFEVNKFFLNTWNRHGYDRRSDEHPRTGLLPPRMNRVVSHSQLKDNELPLSSKNEEEIKSAGLLNEKGARSTETETSASEATHNSDIYCESIRNTTPDERIGQSSSSKFAYRRKASMSSKTTVPDEKSLSDHRISTRLGKTMSFPNREGKVVDGLAKTKKAKKKKKGKEIACAVNENLKSGSDCSEVDDNDKQSPQQTSCLSPRQKNAENLLYQIGPPIPFIALYNLPPNQCFDSVDTLDSDFASHWQNLQLGRFFQNYRHLPHMICRSPGYCLHHLPSFADNRNGRKCSNQNHNQKHSSVNMQRYGNGWNPHNGAGPSQLYPYGGPLVFLYPYDHPDIGLSCQFSGTSIQRPSPAVKR